MGLQRLQLGRLLNLGRKCETVIGAEFVGLCETVIPQINNEAATVGPHQLGGSQVAQIALGMIQQSDCGAQIAHLNVDDAIVQVTSMDHVRSIARPVDGNFYLKMMHCLWTVLVVTARQLHVGYPCTLCCEVPILELNDASDLRSFIEKFGGNKHLAIDANPAKVTKKRGRPKKKNDAPPAKVSDAIDFDSEIILASKAITQRPPKIADNAWDIGKGLGGLYCW
ncbi:DNA ligase [Sesbania bispinosa]|nr:DNA ligase [Sesbania bispinosa]